MIQSELYSYQGELIETHGVVVICLRTIAYNGRFQVLFWDYVGPILMMATAVSVLWSILKYQTAYVALINSLPPQFQDGLSSKFAVPEYVLQPSTPLALQAEYVEAQIGSCFAALGISLLFFLYEKAIVGSIVGVLFIWLTALTIKSWKTYQTNCNRRPPSDEEEQL